MEVKTHPKNAAAHSWLAGDGHTPGQNMKDHWKSNMVQKVREFGAEM